MFTVTSVNVGRQVYLSHLYLTTFIQEGNYLQGIGWYRQQKLKLKQITDASVKFKFFKFKSNDRSLWNTMISDS